MKISEALGGVVRLYVETAPFIYYVEDDPRYSEKLKQIFGTVTTGQIEIITSVITLVETLSKPMKVGDKAVEHAYQTMLQQTQGIILMPIDASVAGRAASLRARYNLRTPDALHVAAALVTRCDAFLTNDLTLRRIAELPIIVLNDLDPAES